MLSVLCSRCVCVLFENTSTFQMRLDGLDPYVLARSPGTEATITLIGENSIGIELCLYQLIRSFLS